MYILSSAFLEENPLRGKDMTSYKKRENQSYGVTGVRPRTGGSKSRQLGVENISQAAGDIS